jgi:hypothetical protein
MIIPETLRGAAINGARDGKHDCCRFIFASFNVTGSQTTPRTHLPFHFVKDLDEEGRKPAGVHSHDRTRQSAALSALFAMTHGNVGIMSGPKLLIGSPIV